MLEWWIFQVENLLPLNSYKFQQLYVFTALLPSETVSTTLNLYG